MIHRVVARLKYLVGKHLDFQKRWESKFSCINLTKKEPPFFGYYDTGNWKNESNYWFCPFCNLTFFIFSFKKVFKNPLWGYSKRSPAAKMQFLTTPLPFQCFSFFLQTHKSMSCSDGQLVTNLTIETL